MRSLVAIVFIFVCASVAWVVLGGTIVARTDSSDYSQRQDLAGLWGAEQTQSPATFAIVKRGFAAATKTVRAHAFDYDEDTGPAHTVLDVDLALDQRQKGLLWYNTYTVVFGGTYRVAIPRDAKRLHVELPFAAQAATYENVSIVVDGTPQTTSSDGSHLIAESAAIPRGATATVAIAYRSHGLGTWKYVFGDHVSDVRNFTMNMHTNFAAIDYPPQTLSPTSEHAGKAGWDLQWSYRDLIAGYGIGMAFPDKLQPGPLASRISFWAPLSLGFYLFVLVTICALRKIELHPMNYFFLSASFFAFHLLFAYTVDRIPVAAAFALASVVSMFLTISYLRLVVGLRFAAVEAALAQFFYLILFSLALFNEGYSGLSITIGAIVTLFAVMQLTAKLDWSAAMRRRTSPAATPPEPLPA